MYFIRWSAFACSAVVVFLCIPTLRAAIVVDNSGSLLNGEDAPAFPTHAAMTLDAAPTFGFTRQKHHHWHDHPEIARTFSVIRIQQIYPDAYVNPSSKGLAASDYQQADYRTAFSTMASYDPATEITPVSEAATWVVASLTTLALLWHQRRRLLLVAKRLGDTRSSALTGEITA